MIADQKRFAATLAAFDVANAEDPNLDEGQPKELLYAQRMSAMLARFAPNASEVARLAVRAQHIQRWQTPRASYPMDRQGYLQWRTGLYKFHAETAGRIMADNGYDAETIDQVKAAVGKKALKVNPDTQLLEDITDLVFLEHYLAGFAARHPDYDEAKWIEIIRKTWQKMSQQARDFVLAGKVSLPETLTPLVLKAVA
ncbi:MAG: DUF4202 domain-containing protein [Rhodocyclales bacterium]|nr:DUF4202 domain-containing protein [Rhodocyclales bacterium]